MRAAKGASRVGVILSFFCFFFYNRSNKNVCFAFCVVFLVLLVLPVVLLFSTLLLTL